MNSDCWRQVLVYLARDDLVALFAAAATCREWYWMVKDLRFIFESYARQWKLPHIEGLNVADQVRQNLHRFCQRCSKYQDMPMWDHTRTYLCMPCRWESLKYCNSFPIPQCDEPFYSAIQIRDKYKIEPKYLNWIPSVIVQTNHARMPMRRYQREGIRKLVYCRHGSGKLEDRRYAKQTQLRRQLHQQLEKMGLLDYAWEHACMLFVSQQCDLSHVIKSLATKETFFW